MVCHGELARRRPSGRASDRVLLLAGARRDARRHARGPARAAPVRCGARVPDRARRRLPAAPDRRLWARTPLVSSWACRSRCCFCSCSRRAGGSSGLPTLAPGCRSCSWSRPPCCSWAWRSGPAASAWVSPRRSSPRMLGADADQVVARERSFFGVYTVKSDPAGFHVLIHGTTVHGAQSVLTGGAARPADLLSPGWPAR